MRSGYSLSSRKYSSSPMMCTTGSPGMKRISMKLMVTIQKMMNSDSASRRPIREGFKAFRPPLNREKPPAERGAADGRGEVYFVCSVNQVSQLITPQAG